MTLKVNINLLQDNNGVAGEPISQDRISVNDSFFVEIEVADVRDNPAGIIGLALDLQWDASILEALDTEVTNTITSILPVNPQGTIDNDNGLIDNLGSGAVPNFDLGSPIGINEPERFALLHFKGKLVTENPIPLTVTVSDLRNVAFADGVVFDGTTDIEVQTIEVSPENTPPTLENPLADDKATEDSEFSLTIPENTFKDSDEGDSLTYSATLEDGSELPSWLTFDAATRTFNGTPTNINVGPLDIKVTATDSSGDTAEDVFTLTVQAISDLPILSLSDLVAPQNTDATVSFSLSNSEPVNQVEFQLAYDTDLLKIKAIALDESLPPDWKLTNSEIDDENGLVKVTLEGNDPLTGSSFNLTNFDVSIPDNSTYGDSQTIKLQAVKLNGEDVNINSDNGIQVVAQPGDVTGDGNVSGLDAYQISRLAVGLNTDDDSFAGVEPNVLGDLNQDRVISAFDAYLAYSALNLN